MAEGDEFALESSYARYLERKDRARTTATPAEQEAERRYPDNGWVSVRFNDQGAEQLPRFPAVKRDRDAFIAGAEWAESRHRELLEAAREYRETRAAVRADQNYDRDGVEFRKTIARLLAAAAALEEGGDEVQADPAG